MGETAPCPFCGSYATFSDSWGPNGFFVRCNECDAFGPDKETREESVAVWNEVSRLVALGRATEQQNQHMTFIGPVEPGEQP